MRGRSPYTDRCISNPLPVLDTDNLHNDSLLGSSGPSVRLATYCSNPLYQISLSSAVLEKVILRGLIEQNLSLVLSVAETSQWRVKRV